jgi:choline-glycine betaine transporter
VKAAPTTSAALSLAWGLVVSVGSYAVVRAIQHFVFTEPNPATLVWSAHAGFFWRAWTVAYAGGMAAFIAFAARGRTEATARALAPAIAVAAALLALQVVFFP